MENEENTPAPTDRSLGFWLRAVGPLLGRAVAQSGGDIDAVRARVSGAVSPEDYATTVAALEAIARELGWDESHAGHGSGRGERHGFGPGAHGHRGFGPDAGFGRGFGPGFGHGHHGRGFGPGERGHGHRKAERAYERGFAAGFDRGQAA